MSTTFKRLLVAFLLITVALVSEFVIGDWATNPENFSEISNSVDNSISTVLTLSGSSAVASTVLSAFPGDMTTPIADELADLTGWFLIILCILYAEKFLLTIIGYAVFKIVIPVCCVIGILCIWFDRKNLKRAAIKGFLFAIAIFSIIPVSVMTSDLIYAKYQISIEETVEQTSVVVEKANEVIEAENQGLLEKIWSKISESSKSMADKASNILTRFVENVAVLLVTSCLIPLLVLAFAFWIIKMITGIDFGPAALRHVRRKKTKSMEDSSETGL